jgi:Do/DeqQ family serine protease
MAKTINLKPVRMMTSLSILVILAMALFPLPLSAQSRDAARELQNAFREVSSEVLPVVVEVNTVNIVERRSVNPFEFFFRSPNSPGGNEPFQNEQFRQQGLGSGVIVERRGNTIYVLTNNHVVEGADEIEVNLNDGRTFDAEMIGGDPLRDLALVAFDTREDVPVARLGDSDEVWVGDWVLAVGNPLGFESTVTAGIISAKGRRAQGQSFTDYLQTDASINRGNSGGALVNLDGEVIGINTFIASNSGGSIGLGFAIPINNARRAIDDFISKGSVEYAWLGVNMGDLNDTIAEELQIEDRAGAFIYNVYGESPAMEGGILPGDLIISMAGRTVEDSDDLSRTVASLSPGEEVPVRLIRNGNTVSINIPLAVRTIERDGMKVNVWPGFSVVPVTSDIRDQMRIPRNAGNVLIGGVVNDSAASALGLRSGDVIKSINRRNVRDLKDFYDRINTDDRLEIKVVRQGHELEFILNK